MFHIRNVKNKNKSKKRKSKRKIKTKKKFPHYLFLSNVPFEKSVGNLQLLLIKSFSKMKESQLNTK